MADLSFALEMSLAPGRAGEHWICEPWTEREAGSSHRLIRFGDCSISTDRPRRKQPQPAAGPKTPDGSIGRIAIDAPILSRHARRRRRRACGPSANPAAFGGGRGGCWEYTPHVGYNSSMIRVSAPSRLHFGLFSLAAEAEA